MVCAASAHDLATLRSKLASTSGCAARKLWRRTDLTNEDEIFLDLVCERVSRIGTSYLPKSGASLHQSFHDAPMTLRGTFVSYGRL